MHNMYMYKQEGTSNHNMINPFMQGETLYSVYSKKKKSKNYLNPNYFISFVLLLVASTASHLFLLKIRISRHIFWMFLV